VESKLAGLAGRVKGFEGLHGVFNPRQHPVTLDFYDLEEMAVSPFEMRAQLGRLLGSPELASSPRLCLLLRHIVEHTISGRAVDLKEFSIGVDVFERPDNYDPKEDSIVRVQAKRLRDRLQLYYANGGTSDPVVIDIPKGGYVATFATRHELQQKPAWSPASGRYALWFGLAACAALAIAAAAWIPLRKSSAVSRLEPAAITAMPGDEAEPEWASDGRQIVFTWTGRAGGSPHVYWKANAGAEPVRLTGSVEPEYRPRWNADSSRVAMLRANGKAGFSLIIADVVERKEVAAGEIPGLSTDLVPGFDWSPDGRSIAFSDTGGSAGPAHITLRNLDTGVQRSVTSPPPGTSGDLHVRFSPDGTRIAVLRSGLVDLVVLPLTARSNSEELHVLSSNYGIRGFAWLDRATLVYGAMGEDGVSGLWRAGLRGGTPERLTPPGVSAESPSPNRPDSTVAYVAFHHDVNIVKYSLVDRSTEPLVSSTSLDGAPALSADGRQLAFISERSGFAELWTSRSDGGAENQLTHLEGAGFMAGPPAWSPDGNLIALQIRIGGNSDIYLQPTAGGPLRRFTSEQSREYFPQFSRDGQFVYFTSDRTGQMEAFRQPIAGGAAGQVSQGGATMVRESGQDRLFYKPHTGFWLDNRSPVRFPAFADVGGVYPAITACVRRGRLFYLTQPNENGLSILAAIDLHSGTRQELATFANMPPFGRGAGMDVSPDAGFVVLAQDASRESDIRALRLLR
jgi:Tol biopolymer transport system component